MGETGESSRGWVAQGRIKDHASHFKDCILCRDKDSQKTRLHSQFSSRVEPNQILTLEEVTLATT